MAEIIEMRAADLILDYNLYPRHKIDATHVLHIQAALRAGEALPPVVADRESLRVIDGFNRITANLKEFGEDATIEVELRDYASEAEMVLDAMYMNSGHGDNLSPFDRVRCIMLAEEFKIGADDLARALRMPADDIADMRIKRTAKTRGGAVTPIKQGLGHLAGRKLTKKQEAGNESYGGLRPLFYVNQVVLILEQDLVDDTNARLLERLGELRDLLNSIDLSVRESA